MINKPFETSTASNTVSCTQLLQPTNPHHVQTDSTNTQEQHRCLFDLSHPDYHYLLDHQVYGKPMFPAAGFIELVLYTLHSRQPQKHHRISRLMINNGLILNKSFRTIVVVSIKPAGPVLEFTIASYSKNGRNPNVAPTSDNDNINRHTLSSYQEHASGKISVSFDTPNLEHKPDPFSGFSTSSDVKQFYARYNKRGLTYGSQFRAVTAFTHGDQQCFGEITLPNALPPNKTDITDPISNTTASYQIHPVMLDSCFQLVINTLPTQLQQQCYVPIGCKNFTLITSVQEPSMWVSVKYLPENSHSDQLITAQLQLFKKTNEPIATIEKLWLRAVDRASFDSGNNSQGR